MQSDKFRVMADKLQPAIDNKLAPRQTNTWRKIRLAESAEADGRRLQVIQDKLRALADAWDALTVPDLLSGITTKTVIEDLIDLSRYPNETTSPDVCARLRKARITPQTFEDAKAALLVLGDPDAGKLTLEQQIREMERDVARLDIPGFFPTPREIADRMIEAANIGPEAAEEGFWILEPSAGRGDLADAIRDALPNVPVKVIECSPTLYEILKLKGYDLVATEFLSYYEPGPDVIIMNPPFEHGWDINHVKHAYHILKPGGRLVSIMCRNILVRQETKWAEFRDWLDDLSITPEELPDGAFDQGDRPTSVATCLVVIDKPAAKPMNQPALPKTTGRVIMPLWWKQYQDFKDLYPDRILFFQLGDFYEAFNDDAYTVSRVGDVILKQRHAGSHKLPMVGIKHNDLAAYIETLLQAGLSVAVVDQVSGEPVQGVTPREVARVLDVPEAAPEPESTPARPLALQTFVYRTQTRPAMYGTVPDGYTRIGANEHQVEYDHPLTPEDLYRYELLPVSLNAYPYQLGQRVLVNEVDPATVVELTNGRYGVAYDSNAPGEVVPYDVLKPLPEPPDTVEPDDDLPRGHSANEAGVQAIADSLPVRQKEFLLALHDNRAVVKNGATRLALVRQGLITYQDGKVGDWDAIAFTDLGQRVAQALLVETARESTEKGELPGAEEPAAGEGRDETICDPPQQMPLLPPEPLAPPVQLRFALKDLVAYDDQNRPYVHTRHDRVLLDAIDLRRPLYKSLRDVGQLQPIIVLQEDARNKIVDGLHRVKGWWALAHDADWSLDDPLVRADVYENLNGWSFDPVIGLIANSQRKENPVAELQRIEALLADGYDEKRIAEATGLPVQTVRKRLGLLELDPALRDAWQAGQMSTGAAERAARLPAPMQGELVRRLEDEGKITHEDVQDARRVHVQESVALWDDDSLDTPGLGAALGFDQGGERLTPIELQALYNTADGVTGRVVSVPVDVLQKAVTELAQWRGLPLKFER